VKFKNIILFITLIFSTFLYSQREASFWYFGYEAGINFNSGSPVALTNGKLITIEGCTTISDANGKLLFYTDGSIVYNANHQIMPNGTGLLGHSSSTQSAIIVPNPSNPFSYYIFTVDQPNDKNDGIGKNPDGKNDGLNYSEVNMNLQGGLGDINSSKKNIQLITYNQNNHDEVEFKCSEKITSVQHADGISYWVITHFIDKFYAFKISKSGVQSNPIISYTSTKVPTTGYVNNGLGYLKSSPNGKKLAIAHASTRNNNETSPKGELIRDTGKALLYDFNNASGYVSNQILLLSDINPYGIEFSSKSKKLYLSANNADSEGFITGSSLFQFDLENINIPSSKITIKENTFNAGALQLAIDEKIYRAGYKRSDDGNPFLSVINNPEADGISCNFYENAVSLNGKKAFLGLPPFIQSLFLFTFKYEFTCFGDSTHFFISTVETIDSVLWDFGDGTTSTNIEPYHQYNAPGTYTVTLTKTVKGETKDPISKDVIISVSPEILTSTFQLMQCDSFDSDPNDGKSTFNLENSIDALTLNKSELYDVFFYLNDSEALNDRYNQNPLPTYYNNVSPNQLITAKIIFKDGECFSLGKLKLIAVTSELVITPDLVSCDLGDNTAEFDLDAKSTTIKNSLNLTGTVKIQFFETQDNAIKNTKPLSNNYISTYKEIFFNVENNGVCYGNGKFNLIVNFFPPLDAEETIYVCENSFPYIINASIPRNIKDNYLYNWSNNENGFETSISNEQTITVTIKDKIILCERTKIYNIIKVTNPIINDVSININENIITVYTKNNFDNLYALNNSISNFQNENIFTEVLPGIHTLYIKDKYNCGLTSKKIFVLGFPKFFTPNGDGYNDSWAIKGLNIDEFTFSNVTIFNSYGKYLVTIKPNSSWNGSYNGKQLPSSDYWFTIDVTDSENITKTYKGHFSLIRR
jgi:gliding motility-associated-like protein